MRRRDAVTLIEVAIGIFAIGAGVVGAERGFVRYGVVGGVVGFPVGVVVGGIVGMVLMVALALVVFVSVVAWAFLNGGRNGVRELFRDPPPPGGAATDSTTVGDCHGDG